MTTSTVRRLYIYIAAFIGIQLLIAGGRLLLTVLLEYAFLTISASTPDYLLDLVSSSLAMFVVGLGLWVVHWLIAQRGLAREEDQRSTLRRLYLYAVLVVSAISLLFSFQTIMENLFYNGTLMFSGDELSSAIAMAVVNAAVFAYHWRVAAIDRVPVEVDGGTATLRRWYLVIVSGFGLGMAAWAAADLLRQLIRILTMPGISSVNGTTISIASLVGGLLLWLPNYLWGQRLLRNPGPLQASESRSTLRQVYAGLVIVVASISTLGALGIFLEEALLALLGASAWPNVVSDHLLALATFIVSLSLWRFHQLLLADEARVSGTDASVETARRIIVYLTATVGLGALFFGLGGLLSTLLRLGLQTVAIAGDWRQPLATWLALSIVALPVYAWAANRSERLARGAPAEERTLARRVYLYAALLFGIITTIVAVVQLVRLTLGVAFGVGDIEVFADIGRWVGYAIIGVIIGYYHFTLVRRAGEAHEDQEAIVLAVALVVDEPIGSAIHSLIQRELPTVDLRVAAPDNQAAITEALQGVEVLITSLSVLFERTEARTLNAFSGHKILLPTAIQRYDVVGASRSADTWAREVVLTCGITRRRDQRRAPNGQRRTTRLLQEQCRRYQVVTNWSFVKGVTRMSDKQQAITALRGMYEQWEALLASMSEAQTAASRQSGMSIKDTVAHLWGWQRSIARIEAALNDRDPVYPAWSLSANPDDSDVDETNARIERGSVDKPWSQVYDDWRTQFLLLLDRADQVSECDLTTVGRYAWIGTEYMLLDVLKGTYEHHEEHLEGLTAEPT